MEINRRPQLVLASSSPRRQELIRVLGLPCEVLASRADETVEPHLAPAEIVETLALRKAETVIGEARFRHEQGIVIGCDTIVVLDGQVLGKPDSPEHAIEMLRSLQGRTHDVYSGVACLELAGVRQVAHRQTRVTMRPLEEAQLRRYVETGEPLDKAGAYGIQGIGSLLVERIEGDYFNVVGLPLSLLSVMLEKLGVRVL